MLEFVLTHDALDKKCIAVSTLEAIAEPLKNEDSIACAVMDARCNQVYTAIFQGGKRLCEDKAVLVDDLGIERNSEFALEQVFNVIDGRYRSKKPMIITTNLTLSELKNPSDLMRKRIYDRILENCIPLKINNQNIRELNASSNMTRAKQLFT